MSLPTTMKALVCNETEDGVLVKEIAVPALKDGDILVKVGYASAQAGDNYYMDTRSPPNAIIGADFSGVVVAGALPKGTRVAGFVYGGPYTDKGAFAEYLVTKATLVWQVPADYSLADAGRFGIPYAFALQVILQSQGNGFPLKKARGWYLVYGGSTSVGLFTIQLAKILGYEVVALASPATSDIVRKAGADHVFDYNFPEEAIDAIHQVTGGGVSIGFDTIANDDSVRFSLRCFGVLGGTLNIALEYFDQKIRYSRPEVKVNFTLVFTMLGEEFDFGGRSVKSSIWPRSEEDYQFGVEAYKETPGLIAKGIKAPAGDVRGGLDEIASGLAELKAGKIRGKRLEFKIADVE
ncbi:Zinc-binding oxidoreductase alcohol dehydrogenase [Vanrija albida]|uniref:Zinc-binding oxidoreductase alcohol dehydrogenase n=1 Tax=Vanrija albida TaxID=181172 RepID=A0ABR3QA13_9TREE